MKIASKYLILLIVLCIAFNLSSCKQTAPIDTADFDTHLLDSLFDAAIMHSEIPGAVAYINRKGEDIYHKAFGYRKIESAVLMERDDIFRLASMTKALTAVSVLQLYEKGLLDLNDEISKYIPEFKDPQLLIEIYEDSSFSAEPVGREITIHHLLTHTLSPLPQLL
jgi:CubicO group peptidase (beta-lactamase class C family)